MIYSGNQTKDMWHIWREENALSVLVGTHQAEKPSGRPRHRRDGHTKRDLKKTVVM